MEKGWGMGDRGCERCGTVRARGRIASHPTLSTNFSIDILSKWIERRPGIGFIANSSTCCWNMGRAHDIWAQQWTC